MRGKEYDKFIDAFVKAVVRRFPKVCIQWEDFAGVNAIRILDRYRDKVCTFNDDIQGTAAIAVAGFIAISRLLGKPFKDQRFLFLGAGAAAFGIADMLVKKFEKDGLGREEALARISMFDVNGLLVKSRSDLADHQKPFAHDGEPSDDFAECVLQLRPTAIVGVSTVGGAFTREVIENMSAVNQRPIIFPYSNPTSRSECTAEQAYTWSDGTAIFASGSPFAPVTYKGKTFTPGQGNNVFIFPAMGLAIYATEAKRVTDEMLITAAEAVAEQITEQDFASGLIYPAVKNIQEVSVNVAVKVAEVIFESRTGRREEAEEHPQIHHEADVSTGVPVTWRTSDPRVKGTHRTADRECLRGSTETGGLHCNGFNSIFPAEYALHPGYRPKSATKPLNERIIHISSERCLK